MKKPNLKPIVIDEAICAFVEQKYTTGANVHNIRSLVSGYVCPAIFVNNAVEYIKKNKKKMSKKELKEELEAIQEEREKSEEAENQLRAFIAGKPLKEILKERDQ